MMFTMAWLLITSCSALQTRSLRTLKDHSFSISKTIALTKLYAITSVAYSSSARPSLDDVERISKGLAAKKRGVGSRQVPHRLNEDERVEWELAKKRKFLMLRGSGWRRERGDAPLANIYRNLCDANAVPCIVLSKSLGIGGSNVGTMKGNSVVTLDTLNDKSEEEKENSTDSDNNNNALALEDIVTIDFSPLRTTQVQEIAALCIKAASQFESVTKVIDSSDLSSTQGWTTTAVDDPDNAVSSNEEIDTSAVVDSIQSTATDSTIAGVTSATTNNKSNSDNSKTAVIPDIDFDTYPIWRIPVYSVQVSFSNRREGKKYAELIVQELQMLPSSGKSKNSK